jgi:hypothetical protein
VALRFSQPLLCLVLWAALLHSEGRIDARLLRHLGADAETLEALYAQHPQEIEQLRWLRLAGMLFSRESLGALLKARLGELLMGATKASEILALTKALERMPEWIWSADERAAAGCQPSAGGEDMEAVSGFPADALPGEDALRRVQEFLDAKLGTASDAELEAMISKAQRLADRLEDYNVAMRPGLTSATRGGARKPSCTKRRARPRR